MSDSVFLEVRGLSVRTAGRELVSEVGFKAYRGRVLGLVGESGSGKSLTCLSVLDLLPKGLAKSGEISVQGRSLENYPSVRALRGALMGMILQNPMSCFDPVFTIRSHFKETFSAHGSGLRGNEDRMIAALGEVGFTDPESVPDLYPFQMSGGMLQRVMIALTLIMESPFLIADEPTTDLDTVAQAQVLDLLAGLKQRRGLGMLLVTHDLGVIARLADDVAVMRNGRIIERGGVHDIFGNPQHEYTQKLINTHLDFSGYNRNGESVSHACS
ncbi:ABC transporter ATP-binding protein [Maridesulfovibrio sp.]|uniref:ABC transporter ATP-binding protein n=1 Tax=Maridesulfovibrio sp. TaxID=2795000 RepID=UPI002A18B823|nr:ABC transporter ATP-binding protein [Maridesulfovibrio sp.]